MRDARLDARWNRCINVPIFINVSCQL